MKDVTILNVKIDKTIKQQAQELAKEIGLPLSTVVATSLREFVRTGSITLSSAPRFRPETEADLDKRISDVNSGDNVSPKFNNIDEARRWMDA